MPTVDNSRFQALSNAYTPSVDKARVLHVSLEGPNAFIGGVAGVLSGLLPTFNGTTVKTHVVMPFYDYMKSMKDYDNRELIGTIEHTHNHQKVFSSIYKVKICGGKLTQYLIEPDKKFKDLFEVKYQKNIYDTIPGGNCASRFHYLGTAVASLAANYSGRSGLKRIAAVHFHTTDFVSGAIATKQVYNPLREAKKLPLVKVLFHFHHGDVMTPHPEITSSLKGYGIAKPPINTLTYDQQIQSWRHADGLIFVSEATLKDARAVKQPEYKAVIEELDRNGALFALPNGIHADEYSMTSAKFGSFAVDLKSTTEAFPVLAAKEKAKKALCDAGIISDSSKPLFFFVGRFCIEKGMDVLERVAKEILEKGGNLILMGAGGQNMAAVARMMKLPKQYPGRCAILSSFDEQKKPLGSTGISIASMVKHAADISIMTSRLEGCPLAALENLAACAPLITTSVGGISAFVYDDTHPQFNAFPFDYHPNDFKKTCKGAILAVDKALAFTKLPREEKEAVYRRLCEASYDHDWEKSPNQPVHKTLTNIYEQILQKPSTNPVTLPNPKMLIWRITGFCRQIFSYIRIITLNFILSINLLKLRITKQLAN